MLAIMHPAAQKFFYKNKRKVRLADLGLTAHDLTNAKEGFECIEFSEREGKLGVFCASPSAATAMAPELASRHLTSVPSPQEIFSVGGGGGLLNGNGKVGVMLHLLELSHICVLEQKSVHRRCQFLQEANPCLVQVCF